MARRGLIATMVLAAGLAAVAAPALAFDESKYPDWKGKWQRPDGERPVWVHPPDKAPLNAEYQALFDWDVADQKAGGHGTEPSWMCLPPGMPRSMNVFEPMEIVITPATTFILLSHIHDNRRIYTDGRDWPTDLEPSFAGYSIGRWLDTEGTGRYDTLEVETRGPFKGPRAYDTSGLPLHADNRTIVKERMYLDKKDPHIMWNEITTFDDALTRPWTVMKKYARDDDPQPNWIEAVCTEDNPHVRIQGDNYFLGANGMLMPARKGQKPPDLKYFKQTGN
ncbi:MAG TPA: hypothetical protein VKW08_27565 [Xanthobacteraceae bacterium]|jgi:hypothetical protein|nr:hypothetical protein [Xanthobacteraceae bacterium]